MLSRLGCGGLWKEVGQEDQESDEDDHPKENSDDYTKESNQESTGDDQRDEEMCHGQPGIEKSDD